jgi:hypothetical protein
MVRYRLRMLCGCAALALYLGLGPNLPGWTVPKQLPAGSQASDALALAGRIDQAIAERWASAQAKAAPLANDAEFLRRVYLDVAGRIPSVAEARAFLNDPAPDKRQRLVELLLDGPAYVNHFASVWRGLLLPEAAANFQLQYYLAPTFEAWVRKQFANNTPYDKMVRELLTAPVGSEQGRFFDPYGQQGEPMPTAFFLAKESKPENLAASTARLFLGVRLECAQCHNHPFAKWTRTQFWEYASFFASLKGENMGFFNPVRENPQRLVLEIPGTTQAAQPAFLDGQEPDLKYRVPARTTLAEWMTAPDNPYFAGALVNRMWAHFFGPGIVDPTDDMGAGNSPSHPELLDELAREFVAHQFDLKFLIRALTASKTYQLTSTTTDATQDNPRLFVRMPVKGLSGEQLFDSIAQATGYRRDPNEGRAFFGNPTPRSEFVAKFASQDQRTETQTSILQALSLMNGKFVADATSLDRSTTLAAVIEAPFLEPAQKIETLYLATLSRKPRADEMDRLLKYFEDGGPKNDPKTALTDIFWVLLNSSEFILNH